MIETIAILYYSVATISIGIVLYKQCKPKILEFKQKYINKNIDNYKYEAVSTTEYLNLNDIELNDINHLNHLTDINTQESNTQENNINTQENNINTQENNINTQNNETTNENIKIKKNEKTIINFE